VYVMFSFVGALVYCIRGVLSIFFLCFRGMRFALLALIPMYMYIYFDIKGKEGKQVFVGLDCILFNIFCSFVCFWLRGG